MPQIRKVQSLSDVAILSYLGHIVTSVDESPIPLLKCLLT